MTSLTVEITGLFVGAPQQLWPGKDASAIAKKPVDGPLQLDLDGFREDDQADKEVHGGPEKAVHHYPADHYDYWRSLLGDAASDFGPGRFGENISTTGLTEDLLCIGDVLSMGSATVQICQGRQPCWKLNAHTANEQMAFHFRKTCRTGWYYRVLEPGQVRLGDQMSLQERPHPDIGLRSLIEARFNPDIDAGEAGRIAGLDVLSASWKADFAKRAGRHKI